MNSKNIIHHNGDEYIQVTPSKRLFNSTMVHETVTRGDIFAVRIRDNLLTILPRNSVDNNYQLSFDPAEARRWNKFVQDNLAQQKANRIEAVEKSIQDMRVQLTLQMKELKSLKGK